MSCPRACWHGSIDISPLFDTLNASVLLSGCQDRILHGYSFPLSIDIDLRFFPVASRDLSPPFPPNITPTATSILNLAKVPLWMFADMTWLLYLLLFSADKRSTTTPLTNSFFERLFQSSPKLPDNSHIHSLLLTTDESNILLHSQFYSSHYTLVARLLHPSSLLAPCLNIKLESPSPPPANPFSSEDFAARFVSMASPQRVLAREASCSQFDAKLESPSRVNPITRRERRVQNLLPDIAKRRKAELEDNPFSTSARFNDSSRASRQSSVTSTLEVQTREVVKSTVIAALRLRSVSSAEGDYKAIVSNTVTSTIFALRSKLRTGKVVGIAEIGGIVEKLLEVFLD